MSYENGGICKLVYRVTTICGLYHNWEGKYLGFPK